MTSNFEKSSFIEGKPIYIRATFRKGEIAC